MIPYKRICTFAFLILFTTLNALGFDDADTHPRITEKATKITLLNDFLLTNLSFTNGYKTIIMKTKNNTYVTKDVLNWLRDGSKEEDHPTCKAMNHFHNPLLPWDQSFMTDVPWVRSVCALDG